MTQRVLGPRKSPRRRWTLLVALSVVFAFGLMYIAGASATLDTTLFELDKDASDHNTFKNDTPAVAKIGVLNAAVANEAGPTEITICQDVAAAYNGAKILVDAERMTLADGADGTGGGCPSGFSNKKTYNATRGVDSTTIGAHSKAEDVSKFTAATPPSHDWNEVYDEIDSDPDSTCTSLGAVECTFIHDGRAMSIFTQSKDYDEISDDGGATTFWKWRDQSVPDADELDDGMAIKYIDGSGDQQIYVAADRYAVNGTKDMGIWLFHDEVTPNGGAIGGDQSFTGVHTPPNPGTNGVFCKQGEGGNVPGGQPSPVPACQYDNDDTGGDVFLLSSFSGGGAVVTIRVFEWVGPAGSIAALLQRATANDCVPGGGSTSLCATVNNTTIESGTNGDGLWPYSGKSEPANNEIAAGGFAESGVNLSDLNLEGCFSSIMWATRSSDAVNADPKDFILGSFEACDSSLTTTPKNGSGGSLTADSDNDNLDEIVIGSGGSVTVKDSAVLNVSGASTFTGSIAFYICGPFANPNACSNAGVTAGGGSVTTNGTYESSAVTLTSTGRYCWYAFFDSTTDGVPDASDGTIESSSGTGECFEVTPATPTLATCSGTYASNVCTPSSPVTFGSAVSDRALLQGLVKEAGNNGASNGGNATYPTIKATNGAYAGEIEFTLKGPAATGCGSTTSGGTGTNPQSVDVDTTVGNKVYGPVSYTPASPGRYSWQAQWRYKSGSVPTNPNNVSPVTHNSGCDVSNEEVTVQQIPTNIKTKQSWFPNDTATVSASSGNLGDSGTVDFYLYGTTDCTGGILYEQRVTLGTGLGASVEVSTSNYTGSTGVKTDGSTTVVPYSVTTAYDDAAGNTKQPFAWKIVYTPNAADTAHTGKQSACNAEHFSITYTNDNGPGTNLP